MLRIKYGINLHEVKEDLFSRTYQIKHLNSIDEIIKTKQMQCSKP